MMTLLFMVASLAVVGVAIIISGTAALVWSLAAFVLVGVGTTTVTAISCSRQDMGFLSVGLRRLFGREEPDVSRANAVLLDMAQRVRRDGPHILQQARLGLRGMPFLDHGVSMIADGQHVDTISATLHARIEEIAAGQQRVADIFRRAGDVAPALGLIGTLIGLVRMLTQLDDISALGPGMGIALLTTLYGAVAAHILLFPLAARAEALCETDMHFHRICMAGILALARRDHPLHLEQQLERSVSPDLQAAAA